MGALDATWPLPWRVSMVEATGSTNADLLRMASEGEPEFCVLVADHQTAGRGRLDRVWSAPPGANLLVSILFRTGIDLPQLLTQRVAIAASRACERLAGVRPVLKWPNDLLLDGGKLAGVLAQAGMLAGPRPRPHEPIDHVVVGLGLNVGWAPAGASRLPRGSRDEVLFALLEQLTALPMDVHGEYVERLDTLGRDVRIEMPSGVLSGRAIGVDEGGRLLVRPGDGSAVVAVSVGDVIHVRAEQG
jgi:BirA family transcriptional regulator, biotin operon repressor / biotin---[acetyl-CoA-carboxylase] ligase